MEQHVVLTLNKGRLGNPEIQGTKLITFSLKDDRIVEVRDELLIDRDTTSLVNWVILNSINKLYVSSVSPFLHQTLTRIGVVVKQKDEVSDDTFYDHFYFD